MNINPCLTILFSLSLASCTLNSNDNSLDNIDYTFKRKEAAKINAKLAVQYISINRLDIAKEKIDKALLEDDKSPEVLNASAIFQSKLGNLEKAEYYFNQALLIDPNNPEIMNDYGVFLSIEKNDFERALSYLSKSYSNPLNTKIEVSSTNLANTLAYKYRSKNLAIPDNELLRIRGFLDRAISSNDQYSVAYWSFADILYYQKLFPESRKYLLRYFELNNPDPVTLLLAIQIAIGNNNIVEKNNYEKILLTQFPNSLQTKTYIKSLQDKNK